MNDRSSSSLTDVERRDRLRLIRSENVGPITFRRLLCRFGPASAALGALPELARRTAVGICSAAEADAEMAALASRGARLVVLGDRDYPPQLAASEDAPATLAVIGNTALPSRPCIAVVGSRNASLNGRTLARDLARALGAAGFVVVSGLARGVDAEAHRGALASGTVAVLAGGVDVCYPRENAERRRARGAALRSTARHAAAGAALSQTEPADLRAVARRAGGRGEPALGLADHRADGGRAGARGARRVGLTARPPGARLQRPDPPGRDADRERRRRAGGAGLVLHPAARMVAIEPAAPADDGAGADEARRAVAEMLSPTTVAVDEIIRTCQLSPALVSTILLEWELAGRLERHPGNRVSSIAQVAEAN